MRRVILVALCLILATGFCSLWPLLKKDGLGLQYAVLAFLWNYVIGYNPVTLPSGTIKYLSVVSFLWAMRGNREIDQSCCQVVYSGLASLHAGEHIFTPPARYPDLFPVLNVLLSGAVFGFAWLWGMKKQLEEGWAIAGLGGLHRTFTPLHPASEHDRFRLASLPAKPRVPMAGVDGRNGSSSGKVDSHVRARRRPSQPS